MFMILGLILLFVRVWLLYFCFGWMQDNLSCAFWLYDEFD